MKQFNDSTFFQTVGTVQPANMKVLETSAPLPAASK